MKKFIHSMRYFLLVSVFLFVTIGLLGYFLVEQSRTAMLALINSRMLDISNTAASMLDGDVLKTLQKEDADTPEYQAVMSTLTHFQDNIDLSYIYCIRDMGNKKFVFTVDPTVKDPAEFGSPVVYTEALYQASLGTPMVDDSSYEDEWGRFYSSYSPVFDSKGSVAGIVAVDFSASWIDDQVASMRKTTGLIGLLVLLAGGFLIYVVTSRQRRSIRVMYHQLHDLAGHIEELIKEVESSADMPARSKEHPRITDEFSGSSDDIKALGDTIRTMEDELRQDIMVMHEQAFTDGLTQVRNNTAYLETTGHLNMLIKKGGAMFSVCVFDLNGLKAINDNYGHECGNEVLKDFAQVLQKQISKDDIYRVGGDEFIAIIKEQDEQVIKSLLKTLDVNLSEFNRTPRSYVLPLAVSKGYAIFDPKTDTEYRSVVKRADEMMYSDKAAFYTRYGDRRRKITEIEE